ncbi:MAG: FAD:protein FMN transferase [Bacteroidales bacterium]|nr:FAD:protein FMN transferase [Bacteroidales bacterium]
MRKHSLLFIIILALLGCASCSSKEYIQLTGFAQGTTYAITFADKQGRDFHGDIEQIFEQVDQSMSLYRDSSIINLFNSANDCFEVDSLLAEVVALSLEYSAQTNGAFDITIGPLVREWGFHMKKNQVPTESRVAELLAFTGADMIELKGNTLCKSNPNVSIDVNAIAPGFTADLIADFFESKDVLDYLVEVGGEIRASGSNSRGEAWMVGVDKPVDNALSGENLQVIIAISGKSLVTSGNYRKFFVKDGVRYSHTVSPSTGYPVNHSLLSATVIDSTAARADALATSFMVMGVNLAKLWLIQNPGVEAYLVFSSRDGDYSVWMSEGLKGMIVEN